VVHKPAEVVKTSGGLACLKLRLWWRAFLSSIVWNFMATSEVQTVNTSADKAKLVGAAALLLGSFVAFYLLSGKGGLAQWAALLVGVAAAVAVFGVSEAGKQLVAFGRDAWRETKKVVWPARKEAIQMTAYVFAFVFVMALFLWLTDKTIEWVFYDLILGWRK
jgi:preprotein translocase subunit SecE